MSSNSSCTVTRYSTAHTPAGCEACICPGCSVQEPDAAAVTVCKPTTQPGAGAGGAGGRSRKEPLGSAPGGGLESGSPARGASTPAGADTDCSPGGRRGCPTPGGTVSHGGHHPAGGVPATLGLSHRAVPSGDPTTLGPPEALLLWEDRPSCLQFCHV